VEINGFGGLTFFWWKWKAEGKSKVAKALFFQEKRDD